MRRLDEAGVRTGSRVAAAWQAGCDLLHDRRCAPRTLRPALRRRGGSGRRRAWESPAIAGTAPSTPRDALHDRGLARDLTSSIEARPGARPHPSRPRVPDAGSPRRDAEDRPSSRIRPLHTGYAADGSWPSWPSSHTHRDSSPRGVPARRRALVPRSLAQDAGDLRRFGASVRAWALPSWVERAEGAD